jgi:ParB family transcriptional regulator, chromosome partitioning protein
MPKDMKAMLARKLAENTQRHAEANQDLEFDAGRQYTKLSVELIDPNPYQPRRIFPQDELEALASSISESGLLQPISVRKNGERYQIIAGERRWRAYKLLERHTIEALVIPVEDSDMAVLSLAENIDREDLSDYEIGKALRQVESLFPTKKKLAESLGLNREDMYRYYAFESLPESIQVKLDLNPRLLSRAAAVDLKRFLQQHEGLPLAMELLMEAWELLEAGELEQTKLTAHVARELKARFDGGEHGSHDVQELVRRGKKVGSISRDGKNLVIKLKVGTLSQKKESQLYQFLEKLIV